MNSGKGEEKNAMSLRLNSAVAKSIEGQGFPEPL